MNQTQRLDWKSTILAIFALALLVALGYFLFTSLFSLGAAIAAPIVAGVSTILVSVFSFLLQRRSESRKQLAEHIREQKTPLYEEFLLLAFNQIHKPITEEELTEYFRVWIPKIAIWGSDSVLLEVANWKRLSNKSPSSPAAPLKNFARLFLVMRSDLGHDNKGVTDYELLSLFVTDIEDYAQYFK